MPPAAIQSETSPLSGRPGRARIATDAATGKTKLATFAPCFRPGSSLSVRTMTRRPARLANTSSHWVRFASVTDAIAPPWLHMETRPSRSTTLFVSFSPSVT